MIRYIPVNIAKHNKQAIINFMILRYFTNALALMKKHIHDIQELFPYHSWL